MAERSAFPCDEPILQGLDAYCLGERLVGTCMRIDHRHANHRARARDPTKADETRDLSLSLRACVG